MADEDGAIADTALETASGQEQEQVETPEIETEGEGQEEEDEVVELDFGFKKYPVPKTLKEAVEQLRAASTQKTQDASARQKALDTREGEIEQRLKATDEELDLRATVRHIDTELKRFEKYDFQAYQEHRRTDPMGAQEAWDYVQHLRNQKAELSTTLTAKQQERSQTAQQATAKRYEEAAAYAATVPGWTPDRGNQIADWLRKEGVEDSFIHANMGATFLKLANLAYSASQALAKPKPAPTPPPESKTVIAKTPPSSSGVLRDDLSPDEWAKRFRKRMAAHG